MSATAKTRALQTASAAAKAARPASAVRTRTKSDLKDIFHHFKITYCLKVNFNLDYETAKLRDFEISSNPVTSYSRNLIVSLSRDLAASFSIFKLILLT